MTFLLIMIYVAFIGLGLPDGLLGTAWPVMHLDIHAPLALAGVVSFIITMGTIISSLLSDRLTHRFGAGRVTAFSVAMTAAALFLFSVADSFWVLCAAAIPYGLGAGAVDAALNNVVALHYSARHMSWLHCFWGVGASVGPYVMAWTLKGSVSWHGGYIIIGALQCVISLVLWVTVPTWNKRLRPVAHDNNNVPHTPLTLRQVFRIRGVKPLLLGFFFYSCAEMLMMLWTGSYLTEYRRIEPSAAAVLSSLFYIGMMSGRFINGFLAERFSDRALIRLGLCILTPGIALVFMPFYAATAAGLLIIGLGCAPIYPCIIHSTPQLFGKDRSQSIIGIEMAAAYSGSCLMPPLFGVIADCISLSLFPAFLLGFTVLVFLLTERLHRRHTA